MTADDMGLVQEYARSNSEEAFSMIVSRHINLVYSVALRQVGDAHQAEEITQVVFILLARKAGALSPKTILSGWLCRTARNVSARALTMKGRRERREQEAYMQSIMNEPEAEAWSQITPLLDGALEQLGGKDHDAIVLRFFEGKSFKDVGLALGASEDTAKKRVSRTLEKLRRFFLKRGVVLSTAIIAGAVTANSVKAAPAALAKSVTAAAISNGAAATGSTFLLIKGALKAMAWTKLKIAAAAGVAVLLTAGTATVVINRVVQPREDAVWGPLTQMVKELRRSNGNYFPPSAVRQLRSLPKTSAIRPTGFADIHDAWGQIPALTLGLGVPAGGVFGHAYDISRTRIVNPELLPPGSYDFVVTTPGDRLETLQKDLKKKFGLAGRRVTIETNVMVLTVSRPGAAGLQHVKGDEAGKTLSSFIFNLEHGLKIPVVDRTGLKGRYNLAVDWDQTGQGNPDAVNLVLLQQFGLELKPDVEPIEMLLRKRRDELSHYGMKFPIYNSFVESMALTRKMKDLNDDEAHQASRGGYYTRPPASKTHRLSEMNPMAYTTWEPSDNPPFEPAQVFNDGASYPIDDEGPSQRHGSGCNVSSFDGHAQLLKFVDFERQQDDQPGLLWCDPDTATGTGGQRGRNCGLWK